MDYPGKIATVLFTQGCNYACPYCHNPELIDFKEGTLPEKEVFSFLLKNRSLLDGVVITGGEPTMQPGLIPFIRRVKDMGLLVKLDTNGSKPLVLKKIIEEGLVDYIAMDVKAPLMPQHYSRCAGIPVPSVQISRLEESIRLIIHSGIRHEFRTTLARELLTFDHVLLMQEHLKGCDSYFLQQVVSPYYSAFSYREIELLKTLFTKGFVQFRA